MTWTPKNGRSPTGQLLISSKGEEEEALSRLTRLGERWCAAIHGEVPIVGSWKRLQSAVRKELDRWIIPGNTAINIIPRWDEAGGGGIAMFAIDVQWGKFDWTEEIAQINVMPFGSAPELPQMELIKHNFEGRRIGRRWDIDLEEIRYYIEWKAEFSAPSPVHTAIDPDAKPPPVPAKLYSPDMSNQEFAYRMQQRRLRRG